MKPTEDMIVGMPEILFRLLKYGPPPICGYCIASCYICRFAAMTHDMHVPKIKECLGCTGRDIQNRGMRWCEVYQDDICGRQEPPCKKEDYIRRLLEFV